MNGVLRVEVLDLDAASRVTEPWAGLAARSLEPSVFTEPAFLLPAVRHLAGLRPPAIHAVWTGAGDGARRLIGLCAVTVPGLPALLPARAWIHPQATNAYPLLDRDLASPALDALLEAVGRVAPALVLSGVDQDGPTAALLRATSRRQSVLDRRTRAVLLQGGTPPGLTGKARKELRRQWKRLGESGSLFFRSATAPAEMPDALARFVDLETHGWKGRRGSALGSRAATRAFAEFSIAGLAASGQCRIDSLELDGRPIAMGIVLRSSGRAFFWKTAFDEDYARASPGLQLAQLLSEAQLREQDIRLTDSCAVAGHSMIDRLWPERLNLGDVVVATRPGASPTFDVVRTVEARRRAIRSRVKSALAAWRGRGG